MTFAPKLHYSVNEVGFFGIPDVRFVDMLIRETLESKDRPNRENQYPL